MITRKYEWEGEIYQNLKTSIGLTHDQLNQVMLELQKEGVLAWGGVSRKTSKGRHNLQSVHASGRIFRNLHRRSHSCQIIRNRNVRKE